MPRAMLPVMRVLRVSHTPRPGVVGIERTAGEHAVDLALAWSASCSLAGR